jgi:hypothetical protein
MSYATIGSHPQISHTLRKDSFFLRDDTIQWLTNSALNGSVGGVLFYIRCDPPHNYDPGDHEVRKRFFWLLAANGLWDDVVAYFDGKSIIFRTHLDDPEWGKLANRGDVSPREISRYMIEEEQPRRIARVKHALKDFCERRGFKYY